MLPKVDGDGYPMQGLARAGEARQRSVTYSLSMALRRVATVRVGLLHGVSGDLLTHAISYFLVSSTIVIFQAGGRSGIESQQIEGGREWGWGWRGGHRK